MNTVLMWIGGLLAAVLAALFAVPYFIDWNGYRGVFEEEASRILGRDVRVGGTVNVRLLPTPYLRFEKLKIADTRLGASQPLFQAETFTIWLSVPPLLQGTLEARHVALDTPVLSLAVDKSGTGNWTTLGIRPGTLPFVPDKVALQAVNIANGSIVLTHPRAGEVGRLTQIAGEVSAGALEGPYKFSGQMMLAGKLRNVRVATAELEQGAMRFKASARQPGEGSGGADYEIEGNVTGLSQSPEVTGAVTATVPLPVLPGAAGAHSGGGKAGPAAVAGKGAGNGGSPGSVFADVKGRFTASPDRLEIADVQASIENVGQPQLLTGSLKLDWGLLRRLDFKFASRWLDFDRLAGAKGRASPIGTMSTLVKWLTGALPSQAATRGVVAVDQLTLGGAPLAQLEVIVSRQSNGQGPLEIEQLFAALPAGGRVAADGVLTSVDAATAFDGTVTVAGPSLARLAGWAMPGHRLGTSVPDGAFTIDGRLAVGADQISLSRAKASLAGHEFVGAVRLTSAGSLAVDVAADTVESGWLWSGGLGRDAVLSWLDGVIETAGGVQDGTGTQPPAKADTKAGATGAANEVRQISLKLKTGVLRGPDRALQDLVAEIEASGETLKIARLAFRAGDGLDVDIKGDLRQNDGTPAGRLSGVVSAADQRAVTTAIALFGLPENKRTRQLKEMAPMRLAGTFSLGGRKGGRKAQAVALSADGEVQSGRLTLRAHFDGGLSQDWRTLPAEISVTGEDAVTERLLGFLFGHANMSDARRAGGSGSARTGRADIAITAVGVPSEGLVTDAALSRDGMTLGYNGRVLLDPDAVPTLSGTLEVAANRLGDVLALAGAGWGGGGNVPVTGTVGLSLEQDGRTKLSPSGLTVAGSNVSGTLFLARGEAGRLKVEGEVNVDQASLSGLIASLVASPPSTPPGVAEDESFETGASIWTEQPFISAGFDRFEGKVRAVFDHLGLGSGLSLAGARMGLAFSPGVVDVALSEGAMLDGTMGGHVVLQKAAAGARIKGELKIEGATLSALAKASASPRNADGTAGATLVFSGQALSPRSLVTAVSGSGRVTFSDAWVEGLSPAAVAGTIAAGFAKEIETDPQSLAADVAGRLLEGRVALGSRDVDLKVQDGVLRVAQFTTRSDQGEVEILATVDLGTLESETEWRLKAAQQETDKTAWPSVSVFYNGALGALAAIVPRVELGGFGRELAVRRMEYEVEQLERLRKLDEERARQERERQRALAEEAERERQRMRALEAVRQRQLELQQQQQRTGQPLPDVPRLEAPMPVPAVPPRAVSPRTQMAPIDPT